MNVTPELQGASQMQIKYNTFKTLYTKDSWEWCYMAKIQIKP